MITPGHFLRHLQNNGFHFFTGVPCSYFQHVIHALEGSSTSSYRIAPNEGSALALASGVALAGNDACVMIQNSGLGNLINPLTSLNLIYRIPVLLFVSGRAYGISDEPQHEIMGRKMEQLCSTLDVPHWDLPQNDDGCRRALDEGIHTLRSGKTPVVFFVRKGTFAPHEAKSAKSSVAYDMKRIDAIRTIGDCIGQQDLLFATTGKPSRELFSVKDRPGNFYMQGSMGHVGSLGLGAALSLPERRVVVLDGDGAAIMHMGVFSMIGHYRPTNLYHLILDNEAYETTGDQDTTSPTTDFGGIARNCGYRAAYSIQDIGELRDTLPKIFSQKGPVLVRIKINRIPTKDIPRITTRYQAPQIAETFTSHARAAKTVAS